MSLIDKYKSWESKQDERENKKLEHFKTKSDRDAERAKYIKQNLKVREEITKSEASLKRAQVEKKAAEAKLRKNENAGSIIRFYDSIVSPFSRPKRSSPVKHSKPTTKRATKKKTTTKRTQRRQSQYAMYAPMPQLYSPMMSYAPRPRAKPKARRKTKRATKKRDSFWD